jgi:hypothetical protein
VQNEFVLNRSVYTNANGSFSFTSTGLDINNYQFKIIVPTPTTTSTTTQIDANHIIDLVLQRVPLTSKEYYRVDLNDDGIISVSDAFYSFGLFSGLKTNVGSLPSVRFFSQSEWNTIKFSTTNLKPSLSGQSSFTILSPVRNASTTIYLLTTGFSNKNKLTY